MFILCVILFIALYYRRQYFANKLYFGAGRTKAEQKVVSIMEESMSADFPTVRPSWLRYKGSTLELDGYNRDLHLAIEYNGPLHTKWHPTGESYEKYYDRIMRDEAKVDLCKKNNVDLIVVDISVPERYYRDYIRSRLYDLGRVLIRPSNYMPPSRAEPFRNRQLEKSIGL